MNARRDDASLLAAIAADPLASIRMDRAALADLAFGSFSRAEHHTAMDRHLALLTSDSLELDLSDPVQRQFGNYELLELIGEGGMGVVYRARQHGLDRDVAVKLLAAGPWASKEYIERFQREAQNAARMQHPNIVPIYEVGNTEELHFFSMRLIGGGALSALIKRDGKLEARRAAQLLRTIAEAVDYAHRLGVLHLDLKPANVLIDDNGAPHVADFGLAQRLEHGLAADNNEISGTPSYMAPEQAATGAQRITPATDIWGLGAILYELVTGRPPYLGASPQDTLKLVAEGKLTRPREYTKDLPDDLEAIICKCMACDARTRYASARELADDLGRFLDHREVQARPLNTLQRQVRWARREPRLAITALLALAALVIGLVATTTEWKRAEKQRRLAQEQTQLAQENETTSKARLWESRRETALHLQTSGKAFDALPALVANIEEQEKTGASAAVERREVGMILSQGVTLIDRMIIPDATPLTAALSADGSLLAVGLNDISVRWYDTATMAERGRIDLLDQPTSDGTPRTPRLLRFVDDHRLLVTLDWFDFMTAPANNDTILVDLDGKRVVAPPAAFANLADANYSADGRYALLFNRDRAGQFWQVDPWQPLSGLEYRLTAMSTSIPWLLGRDGRSLIHFRQSVTGLTIADPRHPQNVHGIKALANVRFTAWQESHDGRHIALGDDDGHVYLVDVKTLAVRTLPTSAGSEVTWLAFSEDDAWCAAARREGDALAFDVATGNMLHSGLLQHDFELSYIALSHRDNLLIASGAGNVTLWRMPEEGEDGGGAEAMRIAANPTRAERAGLFWAGESLQAGLLATADMDGEVRLWRLPADAARGMRTASRPVARMPFDGRRVADVAYNRVRVATLDRREATDWVELPQPASVAELIGPTNSLLAIAGSRLYLFDAATMRAHYAPVQLPATPINLAISPDGTAVAMAFGSNPPSGFAPVLRMFDLASGHAHAEQAVIDGPIRQLDFSPDGRRIVVVGSPGAATEAFDSATLLRSGIYPHAPDKPVIWASFTADSRDLWMVTRSVDETDAENSTLLRWDAQAGTLREQRPVTGAAPIGVFSLGDKPVLATRDNIVLDPGGDAEKAGMPLHGGEVTTVFAATPDRRVIAHAYGRNVQLYDTATWQPIGPPLTVNWRIMDGVTCLAFDAKGENLLASLGVSHRFAVWPVRADERPVQALRRDAELLAPAQRTRRILELPEASEQIYLRSRDPGAWRLENPRPAPATARYIEGVPVPQRDAAASPLLLDLTDRYTMSAFTIRKNSDTVLDNIANLPTGVVTLDGVDYDIRGGVELRSDSAGGDLALRHDNDLRGAAPGIRVPPVSIAAMHVLLFAPLPVPESNVRTYANIRLHYRDGSQALLPLRIQRELPGLTDHDQPTPFGWSDAGMAVTGVVPIRMYSTPRLPNPHPERLIDTLDLETNAQSWAEPVFIAVTAEPVNQAGDKPVIGGAESRITYRGVGREAVAKDGRHSPTTGETP